MRRRRRSAPRRRRSYSRMAPRRRSGGVRRIGGVFNHPLIRKSILGLGAGQVTRLVTDRVAPQYSGIASVGAGFLAGGLVGGAANLVLNGGLTALGGFGLGGGGDASAGGRAV